MKYDYNQTMKIELLNELAYGTTGRLISYLTKNCIQTDSSNNFFAFLYHQFTEMLSLDLFTLPADELNLVEHYWLKMNKLVSNFSA